MATTQRRVIVTQDLEFGRLAEQGWTPAGVVLLRFPSMVRPSTVAESFRSFMAAGGADAIEGHLVVITPSGVRRRRLRPGRPG
ncbi:MAG: DUF5615 family PIN-like protein [Bacillota bacterium]